MSYENVVSLIFSITSIILSILALIISWRAHKRGSFNIIISPIENECIYIDPLDTIAGNMTSVLLHLKITNNSSEPLTISAFECADLTFEPEALSSIKIPCSPWIPTSEGNKALLVNDNYIEQPLNLGAYEERTGYIVFVYSPMPKSSEIDELNFKAITARGEKPFKCNVITQEYMNSWFK